MAQPQNKKIELLQKIFDDTNTWIHFAEAKNAALIAFNIALITAITSSDMLKAIPPLTILIIVGLIASTLCAIWSFNPINTRLDRSALKGVNANLLHFAYIASLEPDEYLLRLYSTYWGVSNIGSDALPQIEKDYSNQIVENARIALRKQKCFTTGLYIVISMLLCLIALVICA